MIVPPPVAVAAVADVTADEAGATAGATAGAVGTVGEIAIAPGLPEVAAGKETDTL